MEGTGDHLQCVGKLEIALEPKPVGFLCGTLPVPTDSAFPLSHSALLPSPSHTIGAPRYQMLPVQTDLNKLPVLSNLPEKLIPSAAKNTEGYYCENEVLTPNLSRKCESLAVSGLTEYGDELDVVAPTDILKQIFKIPYSKAKISIAVHRIGDTLILNTGPDVEEGEKIYRRQTKPAQPPPPKPKPKPKPQPNKSKSKKPDSDSIFLNFAMHSVRVEACDCPPGHQPKENYTQNDNESENGSEQSPASFLPGLRFNHRDVVYSQVGEKQRGHVKEAEKNRKVGNDFMRVLVWQFHNFRMLLGSDLLIFSNEKYVAVSLHLWDVSRQVTGLTWLDAWLDNLMASVPELAICYHDNGVVQGYEMIKTDDIFLLKGLSDDGSPPFLPQVVQQHGLSVLRFLQENCKEDPGAYWLYKGAGEDVIQLFDLSVMPKNRASDDLQTGGSSSFPSLLNKGRRETLFSLGTLLYRVAHRLSLSRARDNSAKCARFFKKCLDFLSEQDHLVVRAYAHEEFARLILRCYEELELNSDSLLLESEVNITDLEEDGNYEFTLDMLCSKKTDSSSLLTDSSGIPNPGNEIPETKTLELEFCQINDSESNSEIVRSAVKDPISSKLAAIHHISQAIKSLRWKRQLQNARTDFDAFNTENYEELNNDSLIVCSCGDPDCIEVCDIIEWLPKSKMDLKLWKLVLLLGESYLALGESYKENNQLSRSLKVVELASLVYGSMPETLENSEFISSISSEIEIEIQNPKLFWTKAWTLVGDVYCEYFKLRGSEIRVERERIYVSNEVVREVKRLKKKLGKDRQNCDTCQLVNCSCQLDRASSGNSASSSTSTGFNNKRKNKNKNKKTQFQTNFSNNASDNDNISGEVSKIDEEREKTMDEEREKTVDEEREKTSTKVKNGGIFKFLGGPKFGETEFNLNSAINCYEKALKATAGVFYEELKALKKKKGWAYNELGRFKLEKGDLLSAEREFVRAVKTFQEAFDHVNVILINCNLGHGRRALAEDLVVKMDQIVKFDALRDVYLQYLKSAKKEYFLSLEYYTSSKRELEFLNEEPQKKQLINEVLTQYAHTYLRLGMLLAKEININNNNENNKEILASDAFRESLSTYESLNGARKQEAAFCCYNLGCYYKNMCFKFIEMDKNNSNKMRQKVKWYGNLAEKYWDKAVQFYGPKSHPNMFLNIITDLSALSYHVSTSFHSSSNLEAALLHLLEARHIIQSKDDSSSSDSDLELKPKLWNQLQSLLKTMLSVSISSGSNTGRTGSGLSGSNKVLDCGKLKEMYRMSLKGTGFGQLHVMYDFWVS
ncbi:hypothetical protein LUZ60_001808 [Juncus effusus]|nr:hypothetical protein LUZ60_001808 [Juncus effusus]